MNPKEMCKAIPFNKELRAEGRVINSAAGLSFPKALSVTKTMCCTRMARPPA